ncbi:MAG: hypothetical protein MUP74_04705 [Desulfobacterales bacterium]|nr:hypothetical protein [Desulfobacterales bacterium]
MKRKPRIKQDVVDTWMKIRIVLATAIALFGVFHVLIVDTSGVKPTLGLAYLVGVLYCIRFVNAREVECGLWGLAIGVLAAIAFHQASWPDDQQSAAKLLFMGIVTGLGLTLGAKSLVNMTVIALGDSDPSASSSQK